MNLVRLSICLAMFTPVFSFKLGNYESHEHFISDEDVHNAFTFCNQKIEELKKSQFINILKMVHFEDHLEELMHGVGYLIREINYFVYSINDIDAPF